VNEQQIVYTVQVRGAFDGGNWRLDGIFKSRKLALNHVIEWFGNDSGTDVKIEENIVR
jgi:hypothetical protein